MLSGHRPFSLAVPQPQGIGVGIEVADLGSEQLCDSLAT